MEISTSTVTIPPPPNTSKTHGREGAAGRSMRRGVGGDHPEGGGDEHLRKISVVRGDEHDTVVLHHFAHHEGPSLDPSAVSKQ